MTIPLTYVGSSGKGIGVVCLDSSGSLADITAVASLDDVQTLTLSGLPAGGTFTLNLGGQTTAPIAAPASFPARYLLYTFTVVPGVPVLVACDVGNQYGLNYSATRIDLIDGITGSTPGSVLATGTLNEATPVYDYTVVADGSTTSYMKNIGTVTPTTTKLLILFTSYAGGTYTQLTSSLASVTTVSTGAVQYCGVNDSRFTAFIVGNGILDTASGGSYNSASYTVFPPYGSPAGTPPLSVGGLTSTVSAAAIQSAIQALSNVGSGGAIVTDSSGVGYGPFTVTFQGPVANTAMPTLVSSSSAVSVAHTSVGGNAPTYTINGGSPVKLYDLKWGDGWFNTTQSSPIAAYNPSGYFPLPQQTQTKYYPYAAKVIAQTGYNWIQQSGAGTSGQAATCEYAGESILTYCEQFQNSNGTAPITVAVYLTWVPDATLSTSVPVTVQSSSVATDEVYTTQVTLFSGNIDQSVTPTDLFDKGVWWKRIGTFTLQYPVIDLWVTVANAGGKVGFDSIQVRPTSTDISVKIHPTDTVVLSIPDGYLSTAAGPLTGLSNLPVTNYAGQSYFALPTGPQTLGMGYDIAGEFQTYSETALYSSLHRKADFSTIAGVTLGALNYPVSATTSEIDQVEICSSNVVYPFYSNKKPPLIRNGMYVLEWTGVGDCIMLVEGNGYTVVEQTGLHVVNPAGNRRVYLVTADGYIADSPSVYIRVYASGPAVSGVYPYDLGNLGIWQPDPADPTGMTPWMNNRTTFYAPFLTCLAGATSLRFLDWDGINAANFINYTDHRQEGELNGPSRTITAAIVSIAPVTGTNLFYPSLFASVLVTTTTPHALTDYSQPVLTTTANAVFSSGQTLTPGNYATSIRVLNATQFIAWLPDVNVQNNVPVTLNATITGGTMTFVCGGNASPYIGKFQLCNQIGAACHVNLSAVGTPAYHFQCGVVAGQNLNPALKLYVEFANEPWNGQFHTSDAFWNLGWALTGTFDYSSGHGMVVAAWAAYQQYLAGLASVGWTGTVVVGYGSSYGGNDFTASICSTATAIGARLDGIYIAPYVGNFHEKGQEYHFHRLYDTFDADQARDYLAQNIEYGGWDTLIANHRTAMNTAGYTAAHLLAYEGGFDTLTPGLSGIAAFERTYGVLFHPEMFAMTCRLLQKFQAAGLENFNYYSGFGIGFRSNGPEETSIPNTWTVWAYGGQPAGTGNWTTDANNIAQSGQFTQLKSEVGGGVKFWNSLLASHMIARPAFRQLKTTGRSKRLGRWS